MPPFNITVHAIHHNPGLINIPVAVDHFIGNHLHEITVYLGNRHRHVMSTINRNARIGGADRIYGRPEIAAWFHHYPLGAVVEAEILSPYEIIIH